MSDVEYSTYKLDTTVPSSQCLTLGLWAGFEMTTEAWCIAVGQHSEAFGDHVISLGDYVRCPRNGPPFTLYQKHKEPRRVYQIDDEIGGLIFDEAQRVLSDPVALGWEDLSRVQPEWRDRNWWQLFFDKWNASATIKNNAKG